MSKTKKFLLPEAETPTQWYNILADMPNKPKPILNPGTKQPLKPEDIALKDEGQRSFDWYQIHIRESIYGELFTTQILTVNGFDYKIMAKKNFALNGYREYHAILNYQESI